MIALALLGAALAGAPQKVPAHERAPTQAIDTWLLSETQYKNCLKFAAGYAELEGRLEQCEESAAPALQKAQSALATAEGQVIRDAAQIHGLLEDKRQHKQKIADLRRQRNVAYAVAGSLVIGSVTATVLVLQVP